MLSRQRMVLVAAGLAFLLAAWPAPAQPLVQTLPCIDGLVINADTVSVGKIVKVRDEPIPGGSNLPGFHYEILERLKYPPGANSDREIKQRSMFVEHTTDKYKDWMKRGSRLLILYDYERPNRPRIVELGPKAPMIYQSDFTLLSTGKEVLRAAKQAIARTPPGVRRTYTIKLSFPAEVYPEALRKFSVEYAVLGHIPVDRQLEKMAQTTIDSQDPTVRHNAAKILRYFPSQQNVALLKSLLNDPAQSDYNEVEKLYYIRNEANEALKRIGVEVQKPVLLERNGKPVED